MLRTRSLGQKELRAPEIAISPALPVVWFSMLWMGWLPSALARGRGRRERGSASGYLAWLRFETFRTFTNARAAA